MFFGQGDKAKVQSYVNEVFDKFDYDHSGELSYEGLHLSGSYLTSRISLTFSALVVVQTTFLDALLYSIDYSLWCLHCRNDILALVIANIAK